MIFEMIGDKIGGVCYLYFQQMVLQQIRSYLFELESDLFGIIDVIIDDQYSADFIIISHE